MIKFFKKLAKNKKGSEVVEKIFMVIVSVTIAAIAVTWIVSMVNDAMSKQDKLNDGDTQATDPFGESNGTEGTEGN